MNRLPLPEHRGRCMIRVAALLNQPGALAPIVMSLAALSLVIGRLLVYGAVPDADEGTGAHV